MSELFGPINAVLILAMLPGLVQFLKEVLKWNGEKVTVLSMVTGVVLGLVLQLQVMFPQLAQWVQFVVYGVLFGLTASGYYKLVTRNEVKG